MLLGESLEEGVGFGFQVEESVDAVESSLGGFGGLEFLADRLFVVRLVLDMIRLVLREGVITL